MNYFFTILLSLVFPLSGFAQKKNSSDFISTLNYHLKSISDRDLKGMDATVADSVTLIFPDGDMLKTKKKFLEFHINWFKDMNWDMTTQVLQSKEELQLSYALVKYQLTGYTEDRKVKSQSTAYLLLIFEKQKDGWKLIHDQNTKVMKQ